MSGEMVVLRILHIVAGASWVGAAVFLTLVIEPILSGAGPEVMRSVGPKLAPRVTAFMHTAGITTIVFGFVLVGRTPGRGFDQLFSTAWGWAIGLGMITAIAGYLAGTFAGLSMKRAGDMAIGIKGPPAPETIARITALRARFQNLARITTVLVVVATAAMAAARYV